MSEARKKYKIKNKKKIAAQAAVWYKENRERHLMKGKEYYQKNKKMIQAKHRLHRIKNRDKLIEYGKARRLNQKRICIDHYSKGKNECSCCGEKEFNFMTLDHIKNNGRIDKVKSNNNLHNYLIRLGFPKGIRVLCFNCNSGRDLSPGKICPHKRKKKD